MGATVTESGSGARMEEHLACRLEVAVRVIEDRNVEQAAPLILEHGVVGDGQRVASRAAGDPGQRPLRARFVVGGVSQRESGAEGLVHALGGGRVGHPLLDRATNGGITEGVNQALRWEPLGLQLLVGGDLVEERIGGEVPRQETEAAPGHLRPQVRPVGDGP